MTLRDLFVVGFVALPLAVAVGLILWRIRTFVIILGLITLAGMAVWGALRLADALTGWGDGGVPTCLETPAGAVDRCQI